VRNEIAGPAVVVKQRRRHVNPASDEFRPRPARHRLVALVERRLVERLTSDERGQNLAPRAVERAHRGLLPPLPPQALSFFRSDFDAGVSGSGGVSKRRFSLRTTSGVIT